MASDGRSVTSQLTRECTFSDSVEVHARVFLQSSTHSFPSYLRGTGRLQSQRLMAYGAGELNERNNTEREREDRSIATRLWGRKRVKLLLWCWTLWVSVTRMDAIISHPLSAIAIPIGMPFFSLSGDMHRSVWRCIWLLTSTRIVHTETSTQRVLIEPFAGLDPIRAFAIDSKRIFEPSSRLRSCYRASLYWTPDAAPKEQRIEIWLRNCATCQGFGLAGSDKLKEKG